MRKGYNGWIDRSFAAPALHIWISNFSHDAFVRSTAKWTEVIRFLIHALVQPL